MTEKRELCTPDTMFGSLMNTAFKMRYGEDFRWNEARIENLGGGSYVVKIDVSNDYEVDEGAGRL